MLLRGFPRGLQGVKKGQDPRGCRIPARQTVQMYSKRLSAASGFGLPTNPPQGRRGKGEGVEAYPLQVPKPKASVQGKKERQFLLLGGRRAADAPLPADHDCKGQRQGLLTVLNRLGKK